eukprot:scaffold343862_cov32-Prasinocladus_malaysianus.AAC.1
MHHCRDLLAPLVVRVLVRVSYNIERSRAGRKSRTLTSAFTRARTITGLLHTAHTAQHMAGDRFARFAKRNSICHYAFASRTTAARCMPCTKPAKTAEVSTEDNPFNIH